MAVGYGCVLVLLLAAGTADGQEIIHPERVGPLLARERIARDATRIRDIEREIANARTPPGRRVELANYGRIRGYANTMKKYRGMLLAMESGTAERQRAERERRVAELVAAGGAATDPLVALGALTAAKRRSERGDLVLDALPRFGSVMLSQAIELWRLAEERTPFEIERGREYELDRDYRRRPEPVRQEAQGAGEHCKHHHREYQQRLDERGDLDEFAPCSEHA